MEKKETGKEGKIRKKCNKIMRKNRKVKKEEEKEHATRGTMT